MLEIEYQFYQKNRDSLLKTYKGRFIVIRGDKVVGVFASEEEAYLEASKLYKLGTFLIQECTPNDKETQTFHSRVVFA